MSTATSRPRKDSLVLNHLLAVILLPATILYLFIFLAVSSAFYLLALTTIAFLGPPLFAAAMASIILLPTWSFCVHRCTFQQSLDRVRKGADRVFFWVCLTIAVVPLPILFVAIIVYMIAFDHWRAVVKRPIMKLTSRQNSGPYSSWRLPLGEIRLLDILPGDFEAPVRCNLLTGSPETSQYEALSYAWGSISRQHRIKVNGHNFYVGANLIAALRHLRRTQQVRTIWVDAICINQGDFRERSAQVEQMKTIYQYAKSVVIWLGKSNSRHLDQGMRYVSRLARKELKDVDRIWQESTQWQVAVDALFRAEWWDRVWVIQEVVLARKAVVQCGHQVLPLDDLCNFITNPAITGRLAGLKKFAVFNFAETIQGLRERNSGPKYGMLDYAHAFRHRKSTDPRDKLYALMGLMASKEDLLIPVDYTRSEEEVFLNFAKCWINRYDSLLPVAMAATHSIGESSWCPSWADPGYIHRMPLPWHRFFNGMEWEHVQPFWRGGLDDIRWHPLQVPGNYSAAGGHPAICQTDLADHRLISVKGFTYDTIAAIGDQAMYQLFTTWWNFLGRWEDIAFRSSSATHQQKQEAFNRTLTANVLGSSIPDWKEWAPRSGNMWTTQMLSVGEPQEPSIQDIMRAACGNRRFFVTSNGTFGLGPTRARVGDLVCVLLGSEVPLILHRFPPSKSWLSRERKLQTQFPTLYKVEGQAYVDGVMVYEGDIERDIKSGKIRLEEYVLL